MVVERRAGDPMFLFSCAKMMASSLCSVPVKNLVQKKWTEAGDERSHSSAYICSFEVVERKRSMRMDTLGDSIGSGVNAMMWAPLSARD